MVDTTSRGMMLQQMSELENEADELKQLLGDYYERLYQAAYPSYESFLNCVVIAPLSVPPVDYQSNDKKGGFTYSSGYLRYFVVAAFYKEDILYQSTQRYIDESLFHEDERIEFGGETQDGLRVQASLPKTLAELIADLKKKK